ncbi:sulfatase-like hydrolase/transferase [Fulvivirga sp. M361]|uniref:sulfatase-like hydrolase/transferase n=1 Tax=Fulvivirga sp. M361 TaxID=2594266 RepID=UPI002105C7AA|nr:sulfatase-like hydrolase/transferase [Fulvivirga sp. M361]
MSQQYIRLINRVIVLLSFLFISACSTSEDTADDLPNIVFIFADDLTYSAIHALGNKEIQTPALDRMVEEGITFTHA